MLHRKEKPLFALIVLIALGMFVSPAQAKVSKDISAGIIAISFAAYPENEPLRNYVSPTINEGIYRDGSLETIANQYVGSTYAISIHTSVDTFDNNAGNNCLSNVSFSFFNNGTPVSGGFPLVKAWNNNYETNTSINFDKPGTYSVKLTGDFTCKRFADGKVTSYPVQQEYWLAKVVNKVIPSKASISSVKCPAKFKISKTSDLTYKCSVKVLDKDHVIDQVSITSPFLGMTRFLCDPVRLKIDKSWIKTATGWEVPASIKCPMVSPAMYDNLVRAATVNFFADITDQQINKGEKFTEYEYANYTFDSTRKQFTFPLKFSK